MNPIEQLLLNWLKQELTKNPQLAGQVLQNILQQLKADPTIISAVVDLVDQLLPVILSGIK